MVDVTMPQLGETVTEGTIIRWFKQVGDPVEADEILFEISTDKVDSEVPSPTAGVVTEILAGEGDVVEVGQVLARVGSPGEAPGPESEPASEPEPSAPEPPPAVPAPGPTSVPDSEPAPAAPIAEPPSPEPVPEPAIAGTAASGPMAKVLSPVVRRLIAENDLDPDDIVGTGLGGRVTRADVEAVIRARADSLVATSPAAEPQAPAEPSPSAASPEPAAPQAAAPPPSAAEPVVAPPPAPVPPPPAPPPVPAPSPRSPAARPGDRVVKLNNIRRRTAEHMVMSKQTSPHVLTAIEIDYEGVEQVRRSHKAAWKAEEGFSLTYLPFICRAVVDALREYPHLNATFGDGELIVHASVNLAIAVDIDFTGLLAPVVKDADGKRLRQIARDVVDLAARARTKQLGLDDLTGGTFTLTNAGQYGTMMQFPIINQPQVAILSTDGVSRKPVVVTDGFGNESIAIHSVGVLAMAWDHRAFDGAYAAAFLHRVKEIIETRDWEAEVR